MKIVQLLSALAVIVVGFVASRFVFVPIVVFGLTAALVAAAVLIEGLAHRRFVTRSGTIDRSMQTKKFWATAFLNGWIFAMCVALVTVIAVTRL